MWSQMVNSTCIPETVRTSTMGQGEIYGDLEIDNVFKLNKGF